MSTISRTTFGLTISKLTPSGSLGAVLGALPDFTTTRDVDNKKRKTKQHERDVRIIFNYRIVGAEGMLGFEFYEMNGDTRLVS